MIKKFLIYGILSLLIFSSCENEVIDDNLDGELYSKKYELTYSKPLKLDTFKASLQGDDLNSSIVHFTITRYDGVLLYEEYVDGEQVIGDDEDLDSLDIDTRNRLVHSRIDNYLQDKSELIILFEKVRPQVKGLINN
ncbi:MULTISPECIES: hypothetical protein [Flammeovirga]|uniref:Uncharacterized protein n=1 Tax=Flammeovirga agarivorans TaxID=2726742 RepID=A0A7X8SL66_9BACT|nr:MULTISPECIES: hypothetical protein [Flammeovirga]NLR92263.1 hypothetical protein [Flammeovirga agarivorans]